MSSSIRVSAKTVDDAITEALVQLGVTSDQLDYEIIEKGSQGFLGIGMKQAVIEAWRKPEAAKESEEDFDFHFDFHDVEEDQDEESLEIKQEKTEKNKKPAPKNAQEKEKTIETETPPTEVKKESNTAPITEESKQAVETFLKDTLTAMDMSVELESSIDEDGALAVEMQGENMGILIGKRGQTLDALQYLANRVANKHQEGYVRVKLDTENYRARREETLKHLAKNIAHKVKRNKKPIALEPMNPYERRIIHSTLQSDPYVTTHSEGEEPYRKVVVTLKK